MLLLAMLEKDEILEMFRKANHSAAPGTDSIPSFLYHKCFVFLGALLTEVVREIHRGEVPTVSQRTSLMVFADKSKKPNSTLVKDKSTLSLLNTDSKIATGLEAT